MRTVTAKGAGGRLTQTIEAGPHRLAADEPATSGGDDQGPSPHEWVLAGLGACTAMTLRMYAARKEWPLADVEVSVSGEHKDGAFLIRRTIRLSGSLDAAQRDRLLEIAGKCPVHKTLTGRIEIRSELSGAAS